MRRLCLDAPEMAWRHFVNSPRRRVLVAAALLASGVAGCHERAGPSGSKGGPAPAPTAPVYGLGPGEDVPPSCRAYAQKVVQCMQDPHFPADARAAQTSALQQMMGRMKLADVPVAERADAAKNAADECDVTLSALRAASGTSCPSAF
jgi:hypothetical protein